MPPRLFCATPLPPAIAERARAQFDARLSQDSQPDAAAVLAILAADPTLAAVLVSARVRMDAAAIAQLPAQLRLIAACSVGYDHIDIGAAAARAIYVSNTPDVVSDDYAARLGDAGQNLDHGTVAAVHHDDRGVVHVRNDEVLLRDV